MDAMTTSIPTVLNAVGPTYLSIVLAGRFELPRARTGAIAGLTFCVSGVLFLLIPSNLARGIGSLSIIAATVLLMTDARLLGRARRATKTRRYRFVTYVAQPIALAIPLVAVAVLVPEFPRLFLAAIAIVGGLVIVLQDLRVRGGRRDD